MKIVLVAPIPPPYGGISNWVLLVKRYMENRSDIEMKIINSSPSTRVTEGRKLKDRIIDGGLKMFKIKKDLVNQIGQEVPDVVHITTSGSLGVFRDLLILNYLNKNNIPSVYHIHFGRIPEIATKKSLEWKLMSKAIKLASTTIAIDNRTYETLTSVLQNNKIINIANPIDISEMPLSIEKIKSKEIMYLGWVIQKKGIEELLKAWGELVDKHPDWKLKVVGPYEDEYLEILKSKYSFENVEFLGEKKHKEALELLNKSEIFVLPSYTEGFPNVILEAMALSKAIVATNVGAIPEMLSGNCGVTINPKDTAELQEKLNSMIDNELQRVDFGEKCNKKVNDLYTLENICKQYIEIWKTSY